MKNFFQEKYLSRKVSRHATTTQRNEAIVCLLYLCIFYKHMIPKQPITITSGFSATTELPKTYIMRLLNFSSTTFLYNIEYEYS